MKTAHRLIFCLAFVFSCLVFWAQLRFPASVSVGCFHVIAILIASRARSPELVILIAFLSGVFTFLIGVTVSMGNQTVYSMLNALIVMALIGLASWQSIQLIDLMSVREQDLLVRQREQSTLQLRHTEDLRKRRALTSVMEDLRLEVSQRKTAETELRRREDLLTEANEAMVLSQHQLQVYANELEVANKDLEEFAYIASHDLRSPIRGIAQLARFIREDEEDTLSSASLDHLDRLDKRVRRMQTLLDDLLTYSRIGQKSVELAEIDLRVLILDMVDLLAIDPAYRVEVPDELPALVSYATPLRMVFLNLIGNAIKHHHRESGRVEVGFEDLGDEYQFSVSDDGPGIDAAFHERVFKMFHTLQSRDVVEASGMGLAITEKTLLRFGGSIELESQEGEGAKFVFTWPKKHVSQDENSAVELQ